MEPISAGGDVSLEQLNSITRKVCAEWSKNNNVATTFHNAPFKLSFAGPFKTTDNYACISVFANIVKNCASDIILGGSAVYQDVHYTIDGAENDSKLNSEFVTRRRVRRETKKAGAGQKTSTAPKGKDSGKKTDAVPEQKKPGDKTPTVLKSNAPGKKTVCKTRPGKKGTTPGKKITTGSTPRLAGQNLSGRAILLDLIQRTANPLAKRGGPKSVGTCGKTLFSDAYPTPTDLKKKKEVKLYGFDKEDKLKLLLGSIKETEKEGTVRSLDVEHVLEWHNVGDFFDERGGDTCDELKEYLPKAKKDNKEEDEELKKFKVFWDGGKDDKETLTLTFSQLLARAYPSKHHYEREFVLLDERPNRVMKQHIFGKKTPVGDKAFGLQAQWLAYMDKIWDTAVSKRTEFMNEKIKEMSSGCDSKDSKDSKDLSNKGKGKATGSRPNTPTDQDCAWVKWIDETWKAQVEGKLGKLPSGSAVAGKKRPAAKEGNSSTDVKDHAEKKQGMNKGGSSS
ncbi:hypothetical protein N0V94_002164 [Neodidymelliopsis sp. IMI 364377]|nr:hypothetical protein N0V94_002164 [Neodidymelliopsis sp. IMI 364377]